MNQRYEIGDSIGRGGVGIVYRGRQVRPDRPVAIKMLREELAEDDTARARFLNEAELCAQLNHPGIVQIFDVVDDLTTDNRPAIVMELLAGQTLQDRLECGPLAPVAARSITLQILDALAVAHRAGIVHRDIKPANIFLCDTIGSSGENGDDHCQVKVTDFGIALVASAARHTKTGMPIGTAEYMSPEQAHGKSALVDARSDIYAVGAMLHEMLSGEPPFVADSFMAVIYAHVHTPPPELPPAIPLHLRQATSRALQKQAEDRFSSVAEFRAFLSAATPRTKPPGEAELSVETNLPAKLKLPTKPKQWGETKSISPPSNIWMRYVAAGAVALGLMGASWPRHVVETAALERPIQSQLSERRFETMELPWKQQRIRNGGDQGAERVSYAVTYRQSAWGREEIERNAQGKPEILRPPAPRVIEIGCREEVTKTVVKPVAFKVVRQKTNALRKGSKNIVQKGQTGKRKFTSIMVFDRSGGKRVLVSQSTAKAGTIVMQPVDQVEQEGTKVVIVRNPLIIRKPRVVQQSTSSPKYNRPTRKSGRKGGSNGPSGRRNGGQRRDNPSTPQVIPPRF